MSSGKHESADPAKRMSAGEQYRAAFERLKSNKPERLPKGTPVSQNNVAKEAGSDPSALKKARFPLLIAEIQKYVEGHAEQRFVNFMQKTFADVEVGAVHTSDDLVDFGNFKCCQMKI